MVVMVVVLVVVVVVLVVVVAVVARSILVRASRVSARIVVFSLNILYVACHIF